MRVGTGVRGTMARHRFVRYSQEVRDGSYVPGSILLEGVRVCEYCFLGDHGRCWRSVCLCTHPNWTRDPNAQVPHGQAGLAGEGGQYDDIFPVKNKGLKVEGKRRGTNYNLL